MDFDKTVRMWHQAPNPAPQRAIWLALALIFVVTGTVAAQEEPSEEEQGRWAEVREAYEKAKRKAKEMGESMPDRVPDWVKEDLRNVGSWEYRVVETPRDELEATLNELGAERWECFSVETKGKTSRLVLKRRKRSELRELQDLSADDLLTVLKLLKDRLGGEDG